MKRQSRQSDSCTALVYGSPLTVSTASNGSSPTTAPATALTTSPTSCTARAINGSRPTPRATTERWSDTTASWPRNSSTHGPGPQRPNAAKPSKSGTSTSTTIDHTLPPAASHQQRDSPLASRTWCPPTASQAPKRLSLVDLQLAAERTG